MHSSFKCIHNSKLSRKILKIKAMHDKYSISIKSNGKKFETFSLISRIQQGCLVLPLLLHMVLELSEPLDKQSKQKGYILESRKKKLTLITHDMILHGREPENSNERIS